MMSKRKSKRIESPIMYCQNKVRLNVNRPMPYTCIYDVEQCVVPSMVVVANSPWDKVIFRFNL